MRWWDVRQLCLHLWLAALKARDGLCAFRLDAWLARRGVVAAVGLSVGKEHATLSLLYLSHTVVLLIESF